MDTKTKIISGAITILAIATIVLSAGLIGQENVYTCLDRELAMVCDKLSAINDLGIQTRCYYFSDEKNRTTYSTCTSGWIKFENQEPIKLDVEEIKDYTCDKGILIKECFALDGSRILRVGS